MHLVPLKRTDVTNQKPKNAFYTLSKDDIFIIFERIGCKYSFEHVNQFNNLQMLLM